MSGVASPTKTAQVPERLLTAADLYKHYGGVRALVGANFELQHGEIHGLCGENGSGKSTFLKILAGQIGPDRGVVELAGEPLPLKNPMKSLAAGIATVTQETTLVPELSVAENIVLGRRAVRRWWGIDMRATWEKATDTLDRLGLTLNPRTRVSRLRPDERQMVEIARAISMKARVLILDEPTSSLTDEEVDALYSVTRGLRDQGVSTIFVSHRLKEIFDLTDRVTVFRDGETVSTASTSELKPADLIELMVGRRPAESHQGHRHRSLADDANTTAGRLRFQNVSVPGLVKDVSLEVAAGEIVGLAGLIGAGRSELLKAAFGLHAATTGTIQLDGRDARARSPREAMKHGFAFVPAERKESGLVLDMSVTENLLMAVTAARRRISRPSRRLEATQLREAVSRFGVAGVNRDGKSAVSTLSGGNQQKIVLAKWLSTEPKAILLDEPTRGVDVGAKEEIYSLFDTFRSKGMAVLVSSSENPELLRLCDRILVMFRGRVVANLDRDAASEQLIAHYATGTDGV